ncbi:MAG TPA: hypothetical protein VIZ32_09025 [Vicinamibacterales bacterium]
MPTLRKSCLLLLFVLLSVPAEAADRTCTLKPVPAAFVDRVNDYAAVQRMIITSLGPPLVWSEAEQVLRQQRRFANAMREVRPMLGNGGFFTPDVSKYFRERIDAIVQEAGLDVTTAIEAPDEDDIIVAAPPRAAEPVPWNAGPVMWPSVLRALPELPPELEYRFLGRHLLIIDGLANLVVDVLYDALPEPEFSSS